MKVSKPDKVVPSAKAHPVDRAGDAPVTCPSLPAWEKPGKARAKYVGRSATAPRRASVWTCSDTPRETGSDTSWPMPPWSAALNTWMVRRPPGSTVTCLAIDGAFSKM